MEDGNNMCVVVRAQSRSSSTDSLKRLIERTGIMSRCMNVRSVERGIVVEGWEGLGNGITKSVFNECGDPYGR